MKKYLLPLLLALPILLPAQDDPAFCGKMLEKARAALAGGDWNEARNFCETALPLCPGIATDLNAVLKEVATGVEREKHAAETSRMRAGSLRKEAQAALEEARQANKPVVESLLGEADAAILGMDYEMALEKINTAAGLEVTQAEVFSSYFEIVYWFTETGRTERARGILDTALVMKGDSKISMKLGANPSRQQLRDVLKNLDSEHNSFLQRRYYPHMIHIKGGTFQMGCDPKSPKQALNMDCPDDERLHRVSLGDYYLAESETTWWQFGLYRAVNGIDVSYWSITGNHPVFNASWYDAIQYANWLSRQLEEDSVYSGDLTGKNGQPEADWAKRGYRLPTEAEWEYAARAGTDEIFAGTSSPDSLHLYANYDDGGKQDGFEYTAPVKTYRPNHWGLYDMSGNVWEWCWDWYEKDFYEDGQKNPFGPSYGANRVFRGGSWQGNPANQRCTHRNWADPLDSITGLLRGDPDFGFRLARAAH